MTAEWVYASGSAWITFDDQTQKVIEELWARDQATWIRSSMFPGGPVFVDTTEMIITYGSYSYTIARILS